MPEIRNNFTSGKMNKDLDERLVPNGEYRDAMNVQVRTTDGEAAGTVQNLKGNYTIKKRIPPKLNRLLMFKGKFAHTGCSPSKHNTRILINSNYN